MKIKELTYQPGTSAIEKSLKHNLLVSNVVSQEKTINLLLSYVDKLSTQVVNLAESSVILAAKVTELSEKL